jgi:hypothetical protein
MPEASGTTTRRFSDRGASWQVGDTRSKLAFRGMPGSKTDDALAQHLDRIDVRARYWLDAASSAFVRPAE